MTDALDSLTKIVNITLGIIAIGIALVMFAIVVKYYFFMDIIFT